MRFPALTAVAIAVAVLAGACGSSSNAQTAGAVRTSVIDVVPNAGGVSDVSATNCVRFEISPCTAAHYRVCGPGSIWVNSSRCNGGPGQVHDLAPPGARPGTAACTLTATGISAQVISYKRGATTAACPLIGAQLTGTDWSQQTPSGTGQGFVCALVAPGGASAVEIHAAPALGPVASRYCSTLATAGWTPPK